LHPHLPTEAAIRGAVLSIRSEYGRVQQLAEAFFEAREGLKFRPIGRNNDGATTKGYPDAYAIEADGRWAVAEATVGDWRKHIREEDLPRLARIGKGRISCYRLLVLRDEEPALPQTNSRPRLPADSENSLRKEIADVCGLPIGAVEFIFLKQLVRELRGPAHFRLLLDLQLPISPVPFDLAEQVRPIGIQEITPTEEDFADGAVVPEQASTDLIEILRQKGTVVLEGNGASGKTSLALAVGRRWKAAHGAALYLDLDTYDLRTPHAQRELVDTGAAFATASCLLILDNCHKAEPQRLEGTLASWLGLPGRPTVLLTRRKTPARDVDSSVMERAYKVKREVTRADLQTAYRRLARKFSGVENPSLPPLAVFDRWKQFSGDLVAFCLAVAPAVLGHGLASDWQLSASHAEEYIRDKYVDALPAEERAIVLKVAALARLEMGASLKSVGGSKPARALENGMVVLSRHGALNRLRLQLAHHQLGRLIIVAVGEQAGAEALRAVVGGDAFQACYIARKLMERGDERTARDLLTAVREDALTFSADFAPAYLATITQLYVDLGVSTDAEMERELVASFSRFLPEGTDPVAGLGRFLDFARERMPTLYVLAVEKISTEPLLGRITRAYPNTVPSAVASLVRFADRERLPVAERLREPLARDDVLAALAARLAQQTTRDIEQFLTFIEGFDARRSARFCALMIEGSRLTRVSTTVMQGRFADVLEMLETAPRLSRLVLDQVNLDAWRSRDWDQDQGLPLITGRTAAALERLGRRELAQEVARQAIVSSDLEDWRPARRGARRLSAVMRAVGPLSADDVQPFADSLKRSGELDRMYNNGRFDGTAAMLFQIWIRLGPDSKLFWTEILQRHLDKRFERCAVTTPEGVRFSVLAAGVCRLLELRIRLSEWAEPLRLPQQAAGSNDDLLFWTGVMHLVALSSASVSRRGHESPWATIPPDLSTPWTETLTAELKGWWVGLPLSENVTAALRSAT